GRGVFAAAGGPGPAADPGDQVPRVRDASLADLLDALRGVLSRLTPPAAHGLPEPGLSIAECVARILARFTLGSRVEFAEVFSPEAGRGGGIVALLSLLRLVPP